MPTDSMDQEVLRTLIDSRVPVAIFKWSADVDKGWLVEFVSPNVTEVLGYTASDFVSGRVLYARIIHPDDLERVTSEVAKHTASGASTFEHEDYRIVDPTGQIRWVRDHTAILRDDEGRVSHTFGFLFESTAHHQALDALALAKTEAEEAAAKGEFLAMVSHELRTPLTLILAPVDSLLVGDAGPLSDGARRAVERIARNAERLRMLVDDLLDFARLEEGHSEVRWEVVDVVALLSGLAEEARSTSSARGLDLTLDVSGASEPVITDRTMLERIVLNLLGNATKFTPPGGSVRVTVRSDPGGLLLDVVDTGPGIPRDQQDRIWGRFERLRSPATRGQEGVGLGLALVRAFTALMGGTASVESEPGHGARFSVRLPRPVRPTATHRRQNRPVRPSPTNPTPPAPAPAPDDPTRPRPRVLVVDDSPHMRALLVELLRDDYEVEEAADGFEALAAVRRDPLDVIVCDVLMPGMDGLEVVRRLKSDPVLRNIPVILVTARAGRQEIVAGLGAGADDYLTKPFEATELRARVQAAARLRHNFLVLETKHQELEAAHRALGEMQNQLVQSAKLAAIGQFTAGISHELNNPLATILLHTQSLLRQLTDAEPQASLTVVRQAAERCRAVMRTILDHARAGPRQTAPVGVPWLLESVGSIARAQARSRDVVIDLVAPPPDLPEVAIAAHEIQTALLNVVGNALDATPSGGRVTVEATRSDRGDTAGVEVTVTDTGSGIPPEVLSRVFEPFFTTKPAGEGTGLGLSLSRRMVDESGGRIDADSEVGRGTRVRVWLPAAGP